ncbi:MAG TPA: amidohydrolase family protein [Micromonosporaceae bacterium]
MLTDVHNHAVPQRVIDLVNRDDRYGVTIQDGRVRTGSFLDHELNQSLHDPAAKVEELRAHGIDAAIMMSEPRFFSYQVDAEPGETICRAMNLGLAEMSASDPERLRWMASVPLQAVDRAVALLAEAYDAGAAGVAIGTSLPNARLDDDAFEPFWAAVEAGDRPMFLHSCHYHTFPGLDRFHLSNVIGNPLETTICIERLISAGVLDRHPGLRIILCHAGGYFPYQAGRLRHAATVRKELAHRSTIDPLSYAGQLLFDTITHDEKTLAFLIEQVGLENVILGTDFPYDMSPPDPIGAIRTVAGDDGLRMIAEETPAKLFRR